MSSENLFTEHLNKETIFLNRNALLPHYTPEHLLFREKQMENLVDSLAVILRNEKPSNIFLYGKTGTGKTAASKLVVEHLLQAMKSKQGNFASAYMNCRTYNSKYKVLSKAVKELFPKENFLGYSATFVFEKVMEYVNETKSHLVLVLDEIDMIKDLDECVYSLTRANDDLKNGSISILGISNKLNFKDKLDPRTKSSLCERELIFPPYNAEELTEILRQRAEIALKNKIVEDSALRLAAALAAKESGDARTAVLFLLKGAELAEKKGLTKITDKEIELAKKSVEEEIAFEMISCLPEQQQRVLKSIAVLAGEKKGVQSLHGSSREEAVLLSGEVFEKYQSMAKEEKVSIISGRWYREYLNELEMYGLISTIMSGKGQRGQTKLIKVLLDSKKILKACAQTADLTN
ncbi:MAG: AAA family ATPase [Candidatus Diapherotrites archaeon]|nr:AAA family ATPase [Candidatus Diapherotrites archaeon]